MGMASPISEIITTLKFGQISLSVTYTLGVTPLAKVIKAIGSL